MVILTLGAKWSQHWLVAGFTHRRTNVPKRIGARIELARQLVEFFATHPQCEFVFAGVTAEAARAIHSRIVHAQEKMRTAKVEGLTKGRERDKAERALRWEMRSIVLRLSAALRPEDPRWLAFGLHQPRQRGTRRPSHQIHAGAEAAPIALPTDPALPAQTPAAA